MPHVPNVHSQRLKGPQIVEHAGVQRGDRIAVKPPEERAGDMRRTHENYRDAMATECTRGSKKVRVFQRLLLPCGLFRIFLVLRQQPNGFAFDRTSQLKEENPGCRSDSTFKG